MTKNRRKTNRGDHLRSNSPFWIPVASTPRSFASDRVSNSGGAVCSKFLFFLFRLMRHVKNPKAYTRQSECQENKISTYPSIAYYQYYPLLNNYQSLYGQLQVPSTVTLSRIIIIIIMKHYPFFLTLSRFDFLS